MALTNAERLRQMLGESIPKPGSDTDTLFRDEEIDDFLARGAGDLNLAAYYGWVAKAGQLSNLVDVQEGQSRRSMSNAAANAEKRVAYFGKLTGQVTEGGVSGRTRIRNLTRG